MHASSRFGLRRGPFAALLIVLVAAVGRPFRRNCQQLDTCRALEPSRYLASAPRYSSNENRRFQSFFMLITTQPRFFASSSRAWVNVPTLVSGRPRAGP